MTLEGFYERVYPEPNTGCWIWAGARYLRDYGLVWISENGITKKRLAHRYSYELHKGSIGNKHVLHKCDNEYCVNPDHLFLGTHQDNMVDMKIKNRVHKPRGILNFNNKLTITDVLKIRELYTPFKYPSRRLAAEFGVCQRTIMEIINREIWNYI